MNLVIDLGNTTGKVASFVDGTLQQLNIYPSVTPSVIKKDFPETKVKQAILSSVVNHSDELELFLKNINGFVLTHETPIAFHNQYETPLTLGKDRLANAAQLHHQFPNENALCVDVGTCIKFDFVSKEGAYQGGAISPGFRMRFEALNTFTDKLPLLEVQSISHLIGRNSEESIVSGVFNGTLHEIDGVIQAYQSHYPDLKVVLTGGDAAFFENALKSTIFADAFFTLKGLNAILEYNATEK